MIRKTGSQYTHNDQWSVWMCDAVMHRDPLMFRKWHYDYGVVFNGMTSVWRRTGDNAYFDYIRTNLDQFIDEDGHMPYYSLTEFNIDHVNNGKNLLMLYRETGDMRYRKAADTLREQLRQHPRTQEGGFWHKKIYEHQMWLDGLYMGAPFYAEYARDFGEPEAFDDVVRQFRLIEAHTRDEATGLLYHAWDESRTQRWCDRETGRSPHFWGRAMGWLTLAIADTLEFIPENHEGRDFMTGMLRRMADALAKVQDRETGLWYQVLNLGGKPGNYLEASASCMYVAAIGKGVRLGYLPASYLDMAVRAWNGILRRFAWVDEEGYAHLSGSCMVAGLGNVPYRDGSFNYYISEPVKLDDMKGVGAFIQAAWEMEEACR